MASQLVRKVFFSRFAMRTPLRRRISSASLLSVVSSEPTSTMLVLMVDLSTCLLFLLPSRPCHHQLVLVPARSLPTSQLEAVVPGSVVTTGMSNPKRLSLDSQADIPRSSTGSVGGFKDLDRSIRVSTAESMAKSKDT